MGLGLNDAVREQSGSIRQRLKVKKKGCSQKELAERGPAQRRNGSRTGQELVKNMSRTGRGLVAGGMLACFCLWRRGMQGKRRSKLSSHSGRCEKRQARCWRGSQEKPAKASKSQEKPAYLAFMEECQKQQESVKALI